MVMKSRLYNNNINKGVPPARVARRRRANHVFSDFSGQAIDCGIESSAVFGQIWTVTLPKNDRFFQKSFLYLLGICLCSFLFRGPSDFLALPWPDLSDQQHRIMFRLDKAVKIETVLRSVSPTETQKDLEDCYYFGVVRSQVCFNRSIEESNSHSQVFGKARKCNRKLTP